MPIEARADESAGQGLVTAMFDYMAARTAISFSFDTDLEIVTKDKQKLALASSGTVTLNRPHKLHVVRHGRFADVEAIFDGKTWSLVGKSGSHRAPVPIDTNMSSRPSSSIMDRPGSAFPSRTRCPAPC
jgi:hypothetical protein